MFICKQHQGIFKKKHQKSTGKQVCTCQFTVPEVKIVFILIYYLISNISLSTSYSITDGRADSFDSILRSYTDCMAGGSRKNHDCHMQRLDLEAESYPVLKVIYLIFYSFLNFATLPLVIQFQSVKKLVMQATRKCTKTTK